MQKAGNTEEQWRGIAGWRGYEVSDWGRVRSWKQRAPGRVWVEDRSRAPTYLRADLRNGYRSVVLCEKGLGRRWRTVHSLVLEAFVGPAPDGFQGAHGDGDPENNTLGNLRWATPSDNNADKLHHGTAQFGAKIGGAKLDFQRAETIRQQYAAGAKRCDLAAAFEVVPATIDNVLARRTYQRPESVA